MRRAIWIWRPEYYEYMICVSTQEPHWVEHEKDWSSADELDVPSDVLAVFLGEPAHKLREITKPERRWIDSGKVEP